MKYFVLLIVISCFFCACQKTDPASCTDGVLNQDEAYADCGGTSCAACPVNYPEYGPMGINLLHGDEDTLSLLASNYSFKAEVAPGSSLQINSENLSGDPFLYGLNDGWNITSTNNGLSFQVNNPGTPELIINLSGTSGSALLEFRENGESVTRQKVVVWG